MTFLFLLPLFFSSFKSSIYLIVWTTTLSFTNLDFPIPQNLFIDLIASANLILTTSNKNNIKSSLTAVLPKDEDLRIITYQTLLEKFNSKHSNLNYPQKSLLRAYINNVSNVNSLKEYLEKVVPAIKKELKQHSDKLQDKVVQIKLAEAIKSIDKFCGVKKSKLVKDNIVVQTMRYMELLKELKKSGNKDKKTL